jgi:phage tail-like protein
MGTDATAPQSAIYPQPAFYFEVRFAGVGDATDTSFQEVRGISAELQTEEVTEGGENSFVHRLPLTVKHPQLELKRGIAAVNSPLVEWCRSVLDEGYTSLITPSDLIVNLLDEKGDPVRSWSFANAFPVKWEIGDFNSNKNEIAIETIVLSYTYSWSVRINGH